mmetsp:Transcript_11459/g.30889  ORF Transcript_11459/g.30889 Transcript_11459/m.30889 type:complete len:257 (-) Transcript_11459:1312-2082(-)
MASPLSLSTNLASATTGPERSLGIERSLSATVANAGRYAPAPTSSASSVRDAAGASPSTATSDVYCDTTWWRTANDVSSSAGRAPPPPPLSTEWAATARIMDATSRPVSEMSSRGTLRVVLRPLGYSSGKWACTGRGRPSPFASRTSPTSPTSPVSPAPAPNEADVTANDVVTAVVETTGAMDDVSSTRPVAPSLHSKVGGMTIGRWTKLAVIKRITFGCIRSSPATNCGRHQTECGGVSWRSGVSMCWGGVNQAG